jgi:hypothetical protein
MDFQTIIIVLAIVLLVAYLVQRNQSRINNNNVDRGTERPNHDDPNVQGHGSFGRNRDKQRNSAARNAPQANSQNDDPNVRGRGGFGRDKR